METNPENTLEWPHVIRGVPGRMHRRVPRDRERGTWWSQIWSASREFHEEGRRHIITVEMRFDDRCGNGHNDFNITGEVRDSARRGDAGYVAGGCIHNEIAQHFPELAPLIKWHLTGTDGPMHYIADTVYLAGDRDHNGLRAGESRQIRNGKTGVPCWRLAVVDATGEPVDRPARYVDSETRPTAMGLRYEYIPWLRVGEGKARELDAARRAAVWLDATDAELCAEPEVLRAALEARLPVLLAAFRHDMTEVCGFAWSSAQEEEEARLFGTREEAERDRCPGNEVIVPLEQAFNRQP